MRRFLRMDIAAYILVGIGGLILAFAGLHGFANKSITIIAFGFGSILIIIGGCCYWQDALWKLEAVPNKEEPKPFSITFELCWINSHPTFWYVWDELVDGKPEEVVSAIDGVVFLRFTNLLPHPIMIDNYAIEVRASDGDWIELPRHDVRNGRLFWAAEQKDMSAVKEVKITELLFDRLIENTNIASRGTIRGWACVDVPSNIPWGKVAEGRFRLSPAGPLGEPELVQPIPEIMRVTPVQQIRIPVGKTRDISKLRRK